MIIMFRKGGAVCICRGCSTRTGEGMSLFTLPRDQVRSAMWLRASNREDLLGRSVEDLHKNFRLCEKHFEEKYISKGSSRKRLFAEAVPTIFNHKLRRFSSKDCSEMPLQKVLVSSESCSRPPMSYKAYSFTVPSGITRNCLDMEESIKEISSYSCIKTEGIEIKDEGTDEENYKIEINNQENGESNSWIKTEEIEIKYEDTDEEIKCHENGEGNSWIKTEETEIEHEEIHALDLPDYIEIKEENEGRDTFLDTSNGIKGTAEIKNEDDFNDLKQMKRDIQLTVLRSKDCEHFMTSLTSNPQYEDEVIKCDESDYKTIKIDNFKRHQLRKHDPSGVQTYSCDKCNYATNYESRLRQHQLRHKDPSELQMYGCEKCEYKSAFKGNLIKHQLRHKDTSEVQMYKCDKCKFVTKRKRCLRQHHLRHKDPSEVQMYKCDKCQFITKYNKCLRMHQIMHKDLSEQQIYKCDKCKHETIHRSGFVKHLLRHKDPSEVPTFKCDECDYKCIRKGDVKKHQLRHKHGTDFATVQ